MRDSKLWAILCFVISGISILGGHFLFSQIAPAAKPSPKPLPALAIGDIITSESDALSVWRYPSTTPIWTKSTSSYYYGQIAVGDVNGDSRPEIVAPVSKQVKGKGNQIQFKIFVDVYKEGSATPLSSEDYSPGYFIDGSRVICDVMIANVIQEKSGPQINEIVLQHWYNLTIFKWDGANFRIMSRIKARFQDLPVAAYNGTTTKDINGDGVEEIFISGQNEIYGEYWGIGFIYRVDIAADGTFSAIQIASTENCSIAKISLGHRLKLADLDGDTFLEICLPAILPIKQNNVTYYQAYLLALEGDGSWNYAILPGYETAKAVYPYIDLDTGELDFTKSGEEIALYVNQQPDSDYYIYRFGYPFENTSAFYLNGNVVGDIKIGKIVNNNGNEIVVCGKSSSDKKYLEAFNASLNPYWLVIGGSGSIIDLAITK